ncbi:MULTISPECIES: VOC family protein [unclassified Paenibacillus]|uniref:VOC family protein n=1 Tax=unclassified Paenibacillus TaxID=185978 RepID=UPI001AE70C72|nr:MULTISPECIES: VOC family protein [unclassified Paenibacillus]MBP1154203.1 catechol 2,3-dioxygenase-like lactoylglutathione lyase family enzyme [Paenibacillus sp. PvP091]MBP1170412.1 catechol 2,3-dioxygenase-like lactoylglutathione lyase family enzyme [Paenibacillus sp. PvR098]MBP2441440.1 catechol 2,3-dioxygenase-like lactoylglutathione lyase family enzyme [Paenibacillus sp. PvP052]
MLSIHSIHHVSLCVRDLERSKAFYKEVLGLEEIERPPFDFAGAWFTVGSEGQQLHLIVHPGETLRQSGIHSRDGHLAIRVRSYKEAVAWLDSCGIDYDARPHPRAGFPQIYILDPDRNIIELNSDICDNN